MSVLRLLLLAEMRECRTHYGIVTAREEEVQHSSAIRSAEVGTVARKESSQQSVY
jgi:hypothetical protein